MYQDAVRLTTKPGEIVDITAAVKQIVAASGIENGLCTVFSTGTTCSIFVNENHSMLLEDVRNVLKELVDEKRLYHHSENAHSHIRAILLGGSQAVPVRERTLQLGQWQSILVAEHDVKARKREILVTVY